MNRIKVCCRIRPQRTGEDECISVDKVDNGRSIVPCVYAGGSSGFQLDHVFNYSSTQTDIFESVAKPCVVDLFEGFNCSIFTYGQTGSGKTHTVFGSGNDEANTGILPRSAALMFQLKYSIVDKVKCSISFSVLEIYQEKMRDLLSSGSSGSGESGYQQNRNTNSNINNALRIREHMDGSVWVEGLVELPVDDMEDFQRYCSGAMKKRAVGSHLMNSTSSRSHLCCIFTVNQLVVDSSEKSVSKFYVIDLAGSEMVRKTDATGQRFDEAKHINKSLSALGNVISALSAASSSSLLSSSSSSSVPPIAEDKTGGGDLSTSQNLRVFSTAGSGGKGKPHVPYRDSKLTRLLQNSLGGNAKTVIILTISAAKQHLAESISTLKFGDRAMRIQTKAKINKIVDNSNVIKSLDAAHKEILYLKQRVVELEGENAYMRSNSSSESNKNNDVKNCLCVQCGGHVNLSAASPQFTAGAAHDDRDAYGNEDEMEMNNIDEALLVAANAVVKADLALDTGDPDAGEEEGEEEEDSGSGAVILPIADRCAICGLNSEDSDKLLMDTGETLGELITCDGNCGDLFHVRCIGLLGEAGQFIIPEGEWFCTNCTTGTDINSGSSSISNSNNGVGVAQLKSPTHPASSPHQHQHQQHNNAALEAVKLEYHLMRKERNRVLAHWQQEKKMQKLMEGARAQAQRRADEELVSYKDQVEVLSSKLAETARENERLQALFESTLLEYETTATNRHNNSSNSSTLSKSGAWIKMGEFGGQSSEEGTHDDEERNSNGNSLLFEDDQFSILGRSSRRVSKDQLLVATNNSSSSSTNNDTSKKDKQTSGGTISGSSSSSSNGGGSNSGSDGGGSRRTIINELSNGGFDNPVTQLLSRASPTKKGKSNFKDTNNEVVNRGASAALLAQDLHRVLMHDTSTSSHGDRRSDAEDKEKSTSSVLANLPSVAALRSNKNKGKITKSSDSGFGASTSISTGTGGNKGSDKQSSLLLTKQQRHSEECSDAFVSFGAFDACSDEHHAVTATAAAVAGEERANGSSPALFFDGLRSLSPFTTAIINGHGNSNSSTTSSLDKPHSKFVNPLKNRLNDLLRTVQEEAGSIAEVRQKFITREDERKQLRTSHEQKRNRDRDRDRDRYREREREREEDEEEGDKSRVSENLREVDNLRKKKQVTSSSSASPWMEAPTSTLVATSAIIGVGGELAAAEDDDNDHNYF